MIFSSRTALVSKRTPNWPMRLTSISIVSVERSCGYCLAKPPPMESSVSNTVRSYPLRVRSQATVRQLRPLPITATRIGFLGRGSTRLDLSSRDTTARSNSPIRIAPPILTRLQASSQGASQMRPRIPVRGMVLFRTVWALAQFPLATCLISERASTCRGQTATQGAGSSWMQRCSHWRSSLCSMVVSRYVKATTASCRRSPSFYKRYQLDRLLLGLQSGQHLFGQGRQPGDANTAGIVNPLTIAAWGLVNGISPTPPAP